MQRPDAPAATVREHYTQVCLCEWEDDEFTRGTTSAACSMHGKVPDPLAALETEFVALLEVEDAARQLVRRDIPMSVVALCEANLLAALAAVEALRG